MADIFFPEQTDPIDFESFTEVARRTIDPADEASILEMVNPLARLAANKEFISNLLADTLERKNTLHAGGSFGMKYSDQTLILHREDNFYLRLAIWDVPRIRAGSKAWDESFYSYNFPHNHDFTLLTAGLYGPGYTSENYTIDVEPGTIVPGDGIQLCSAPSLTLSQGSVILFRKWHDIHIQRPPEDFSLSLNLIIEDGSMPQYSFDVKESMVQRQIGGRGIDLLRIANMLCRLGPDRTAEVLRASRRWAGTQC